MTADELALSAARTAWESAADYTQGPQDALTNACRAYYCRMIAGTPGLCVYEPDGTVRNNVTGLDLFPHMDWSSSACLDAVADSMPDQPDLADRLRALAARERGVS